MRTCSLKECRREATHMVGLWKFCVWHHWTLRQGSDYWNAA